MGTPEILNELELEIAVGPTAATRHKQIFSRTLRGAFSEIYFIADNVAPLGLYNHVDLRQFSRVDQILVENLSGSYDITIHWKDATNQVECKVLIPEGSFAIIPNVLPRTPGSDVPPTMIESQGVGLTAPVRLCAMGEFV